jgi:transcriptional regulator with XRE-family HTH domain
MDLATRLRQAIDATGRKQSWVAARANVPEETISRIVTGQSRNPQIATLMKIAPVVGVSVGWLLDERGAAVSAGDARTITAAIDVLRGLVGTSHAAVPNAVPIGRADSRQSRRAAIDAWPDLVTLPQRDIPAEFASRGAKWVFRATDESLSGCGIREGDALYVREMRDVRQAIGHIVICRVAGAAFAKRLDIAGSAIELASANVGYESLIVRDESEFALFGVVVGRSGAV